MRSLLGLKGLFAVRSLSFARKSVSESIWVVKSHELWGREWRCQYVFTPFLTFSSQLTRLCYSNTLAHRFLSKRETAQSLKGLRTLVYPAWKALERFKGEGDLDVRQDTREKRGEFLTLSYCTLFMLHVHPCHFFSNACHTVMLTSAPKHSLFLGSSPQSQRILGKRLFKLIYSI